MVLTVGDINATCERLPALAAPGGAVTIARAGKPRAIGTATVPQGLVTTSSLVDLASRSPSTPGGICDMPLDEHDVVARR